MTARKTGQKTDMKALSACFDAALEYIQAMPSKQKPSSLPEIGQMVAGEGVYLGQTDKDSDGNSLGKVFNVFAFPRDMTGELRVYMDVSRETMDVKNAYGHDGEFYHEDRDFFKALKYGRYNAGWIVPPSHLVDGKDRDGNFINSDNFVAHKDRGAFKGTFTLADASGSGCLDRYWTSTEYGTSNLVYNVRLSDGEGCWSGKDVRRSCRLVRLVEVRP